MTLNDISAYCHGEWLTAATTTIIKEIVTDTRKARSYDASALFVALRGPNHDGHKYINAAYALGIRMFLVENDVDLPGTDSAIFKVSDTLQALQEMAKNHRSNFEKLNTIAITGSNGKTIVKEWLAAVLSSIHRVVRSPGSFNSQLGVPLSIMKIREWHDIGIFEAGISTSGEMQRLARIIRPNVGIFTNIGNAHASGFSSEEVKIEEKLKLFASVECLIYCRDHEQVHRHVAVPSFHWGVHRESDLVISKRSEHNGTTDIELTRAGETMNFSFPFADTPSVENAMHVLACALWMGMDSEVIQDSLFALRPMAMRLQLKRGIQNSTLVDDTYNNDLSGLHTALEFTAQHIAGRDCLLIVSDILQTRTAEWPSEVASIARQSRITEVIGIGPVWQSIGAELDVESYASTEEFLSSFNEDRVRNKVVLIKGARPFRFERISRRLEEKVHGTVLEVNLEALRDNLNHFRNLLSPGVRLMAMVKAFAYGSGSVEVARLLEYHGVDYLGVAYTDEGVALRNQGISLPIMVMNPSVESVDNLVKYQLEPEIYSERQFSEILAALGDRPLTIHVKIDTGMHRLGFIEIGTWVDEIVSRPQLKVASVFSHLASADDPGEDHFTSEQARRFTSLADELSEILGYMPYRHILNSAGISRKPDYQFEMVRLGIGLHGIGKGLSPVNTLKTYVSQVKQVPAGDTIGYGRRGKAISVMQIATIAIGYADGFSRLMSGGNGKVWIRGVLVPVVGNVCMDMTMVDVTGLEIQEGDAVEIFGSNLSIEDLAEWQQTIPYEALTNVSERVRRVYID